MNVCLARSSPDCEAGWGRRARARGQCEGVKLARCKRVAARSLRRLRRSHSDVHLSHLHDYTFSTCQRPRCCEQLIVVVQRIDESAEVVERSSIYDNVVSNRQPCFTRGLRSQDIFRRGLIVTVALE